MEAHSVALYLQEKLHLYFKMLSIAHCSSVKKLIMMTCTVIMSDMKHLTPEVHSVPVCLELITCTQYKAVQWIKQITNKKKCSKLCNFIRFINGCHRLWRHWRIPPCINASTTKDHQLLHWLLRFCCGDRRSQEKRHVCSCDRAAENDKTLKKKSLENHN